MCVLKNYFHLSKLKVYTFLDEEVYGNKFLESWTSITQLRKPIIAAVSGYAVSAQCMRLNYVNHFKLCNSAWRGL